MRSYILCLTLILVLLVAVSCSGGTEVTTPAPGHDAVVESAGGTICTGTWQITISKDSSVDITQLRTADKVLNVLGFMEPPALSLMGLNNLQVDFDNSIVNVGIVLTHPIPGDDVFTGFDVRGVCFGPRVANADGVTVIPSPEFFSGVPFGYQDGLLGAPDSFGNYEGIAGYKYFCDDLAADDDVATFFGDTDNLANRGSYGAGATNERHYILEWAPTTYDFLVFNYAIYANYNWPVGDAPITIDDFDITTANSAEAFCANVTELANSLYYAGGSGGGMFSVMVEIWDWQNNIADVTLECPALGVPETTFSTDIGPGSTPYSHMWDFLGVAGTPTTTGEVDVIIKAYDVSTFGESWFLDLLPASNSMYDEPIWCGFPYVATVTDCPACGITDIHPNSGDGVLTGVTVTGTDILDGTSLGFALQMTGESDIVATNVVWVSATTVTGDLNISTSATEGDWDVVLYNGCGTPAVLADGFAVSHGFSENFDSDPADWSYDCTQWESCGPQPDPLWTSAGPNGPSGAGNIRSQSSGTSADGGYLSTVVSVPFDIPSGASEVNLRVYQCIGLGPGSWIYFCNSNWKIAPSSTPGIAPFDATNATVPTGGAILDNTTAHGSTYPVIAYDCGYGPMASQGGWNSTQSYGGGAFPGSLTAYLDLVIPATYYGQTVKVCFQLQPDECGYGYNSGFAFDDMEIITY